MPHSLAQGQLNMWKEFSQKGVVFDLKKRKDMTIIELGSST